MSNEVKEYDVVVVGAGLSGVVIAERCANVLGLRCLIVERRNHIGGNCYDYIDEETGIRVSKYGAHIFHTKEERVWRYVQQFSEWVPYEHRVRARVPGVNGTVPLPVCIETINALFAPKPPLRTGDEMRAWIEEHREKTVEGVGGEADNGEEEVLRKMGPELYEALFKHYTKKQWDKYPSELDASVLRRIPLRFNADDRYFADPHQALPRNGYTAMFQRMLASPLIEVQLGVDWFDVQHRYGASHVFYTGPIDRYYASSGLPPLEYRSIVFHPETLNQASFQDRPVVNYPGNDVEWTRIVEYTHFPNQPPSRNRSRTIIVKETTTDEGDPYYPVPNERNRSTYALYQQMAEHEERESDRVRFVGRLATYKYLNMDQAILQALQMFDSVAVSSSFGVSDVDDAPDAISQSTLLPDREIKRS